MVSNGLFIPFEEERDETLENFYLYIKAKGIHDISREELKEDVPVSNEHMVRVEVLWADFGRDTGLVKE